jgi:hypothetical protein
MQCEGFLRGVQHFAPHQQGVDTISGARKPGISVSVTVNNLFL